MASVVPSAPDSPALNAAVALKPDSALQHLDELEVRYGDAGIRRWAIWVDGSARGVTSELRNAGMAIASASPGMGAALTDLRIDLTTANPSPNADLRTVGHVNDLAYGNVDSRLERTLSTLEEGTLRGYRADLNGAPAAVALALHHGEDCGVSFVATITESPPAGPGDAGDAVGARRRAAVRADHYHAAGHRTRGTSVPTAGSKTPLSDGIVGTAAVTSYVS